MLKSKLLYRSLHRGCKENDIIFKSFVESDYFTNLSSENLELYEKFLAEKDIDIYNWITGIETLPGNYQALIEIMRLALKAWLQQYKSIKSPAE